MKVRINLSGEYLAGWESILRQEGIAVSRNRREDDECSVMIVGDGADLAALDSAKAVLRRGGGVLCSGSVFEELSGRTSRKIPVKYLRGEAGTSFGRIGLVDIYSSCFLPAGATSVRTDAGMMSVFAGELDRGPIVALPFDAGRLFGDYRTATKSFYAPRPRLPFETVSLVSRGGVRRLVSGALEFLHHALGLPYVHRWVVPGDQRSMFMWRIDTDGATCSEIDRLARLVQGKKVRTSWFVDVGAQRDCLRAFAEMETDEIAIHCYHHVRFRKSSECLADIRHAADELVRAGIRPGAYAAPFGVWTPEIESAITTAGLEYSSEFSYDYDNLPSFPILEEDRPGVLQIPVHPISIGSLRRQGFSEEEMIAYFDAYLECAFTLGEPAALYYHPRDGNERVVEHVLDRVAERHIASMPMIEYARLWKERVGTIPVPELRESVVRIGDDAGKEFMLHFTREDGKEAFVSPAREILLENVDWWDRPEPKPLADDIARTRKFNPWIPIMRTEDFLFGKKAKSHTRKSTLGS